MLYKLKSFITEVSKRKVTAWIFDAFLVLFICCAFYILSRRQATDERNERFIVFAEEYEVVGPEGVGVEELTWRVEQSLAEADVGVLNAEQFPALDDGGPVLVVQAGRRAARLQRLLAALAAVRGVGDALLVVSHSFYDEAMIELVRSVDYCRVLQIFYPFSLQLYRDRFPGPSAAANRSRRVAVAAEHKQHWWWTAHFLFDHYAWIAPKFSGFALFLQEDDYVAPDLLHVLRSARRAFAYHPEAEVISLGGPPTEDADYGLLTLAPWQPLYERGLAFNQSLWRRLQAEGGGVEFCLHDDASWGYSLLKAFAARGRGYADMIASAAPRVLSTREHATGRAGAEAARAQLAGAALFAAPMRARWAATSAGRAARPEPPPPGAGGWADVRDQLLCLDPFLMTTFTPHLGNATTPAQSNLKLPGT